MSDRLAAKIKENAGKPKYSSLNLNQTYKGNKVENKTSTGATRHGLQSLGKIGSSRRIPPPANLPSLKSENSGNDPTVSLVPSGGGGWGSAKDKTDGAAPTSSSTPPPPSFQPPQPNVAVTQQPSLQPQRPSVPSSYPPQTAPQQSQNSGPTRQETTTKQEKSEAQTKTWGSVPQSEAGGQGKTFSHPPTPYFNREFPTLGGPDNGETKQDGKENYGPTIRNTHEPPWMERSGPGPPHGYNRNQEIYNGGQGTHHRRPADFQNNRSNSQYPPQQYGNNYYPGPGGRPPTHGYSGQEQHERPSQQRSGPGPRQGTRQDRRQDQDRDNKKPVARPSVLRPEDIQAMDDEDDDGGWAGAHGEVDYTAKLNFEDFEEEEKDWNKQGKERSINENEQERQPKDLERDSEEQKEPVILRRPMPVNDRPKQPKSAWGELPQRPQQSIDSNRSARQFDNQRPEQRAAWNMQYPPPNQSQHKGALPSQYPPLTGPPETGRDLSPGRQPQQEGAPTRKEGEPLDEWTLKRQKQQNEMHAAVERARKRREQEELEFQAKTKAAAMMKLKAIEEKTKTSKDKSEENSDGKDEKERSNSIESERREPHGDFEKERTQQRERNEKDADHYADQKVVSLRPEDPSRRRTDSDSSDASRSSGSRQFFHQQRNIPPRFQQQRQQQQQQYQQQQLYQATHPTSAHQHRDFLDRPPHTSDAGPVSPSGKTGRPGDTVPVKRIMKRSDSSSTAGDDIASVKSLESIGDREKERGPSMPTSEQELNRSDTKMKPKDSETEKRGNYDTRKQDNQNERKSRDNEKQRDRQRTDKSIDDKGDRSSTARKREFQTNDRKVEEPHKRKRDENEDADWDERRNKLSRDRQSDGRGRTRPLPGVRGRGRGIGRGRQDYRSGGVDNRQRHVRDSRSRDYKETQEQRKEITDKPERQREPKRMDDQKRDTRDKISSNDTKERTDPKKEDKSDRESHERKTYQQEKTQKETQEKGERKTDKRSDRYEKRDDRDQRTKTKPFDARRENRDSRDESRRESNKDRDEPKRETRDEPRKDSRSSKEEPRRGRFASRDIREDERYANQRYSRDGDRYQDRYRQDQDGNKDRETENYNDKPKDERDRRTKDYDRYKDKDSPRNRRENAARHERGGHRGQLSTRGRGGPVGRGIRRGSGRMIGSGRIVAANYNRPAKKEEFTSEDDEDDSGSESSSYTTATSASEERPEDKETKEQPRSVSQSSNTPRTLKSMRGTRGRGGNYQRPRPQPEKPPRFQKQQERAAQQRNSGRGGLRNDRNSLRGSRGRGRGRGRGRILSGTQDVDEGKDIATIEVTEDWEEDVDSGAKDQMKDDKPSRRNFPRTSSERIPNRRGTSKDEYGKFSTRRDGNQQNTQSRKGESFLAEKQVKVEGSKSASGEPRGSLPAAKSTDLASSKKSSGTPKDEKKTDYSAVDSIDGKVPKRNDTVKKANIELFDLHNVAGVICIDDIPDDASDISSSGFVEVTSKRTQKELKEKQREEDERRKRNEEKANQRSSDSKFKKNQPNKPPRFSKQHPGANTQSKSFDGKLPVSVSLEGTPGLVSGSIGSNPSSTNSTKRNSPITIERPLSPQGPVFNAWNKPLTLVTPAKAPGTTLVMPSSLPDPLAVGSGKPSRQSQPSTVIPIQNSLIHSNIEDKSAEDELKEMTKEIESMAPTEEQEEVNNVSNKTNKKSISDSSSTSGRDKRRDSDKKSQPKPQRERPPRFEKTVKRKNTNDDAPKKDLTEDDSKKENDPTLKDKDSKKPFQTKAIDEKKFNNINLDEGKEDCSDASSSVKGLKLTDKKMAEKGSKNDTIAPRKDSGYSVDSEEQGSGDGSMFRRPLSVDINDSSSETQERPPTPVSPAYVDLSKRMFAARKAWEEAPTSSVGLTSVSIDSPSTWSEGSASSVSRSVGSSSSKDTSSLGESSSEKVNESRDSSDDAVTKSDVTKPSETQFIAKKSGGNEQQNVCKVKPQQQQQAVKPQHASLTASATEERRQPDLDAITPSQPVITQDRLLPQNVHSNYSFQLEPQLLQLQHRQHFIQPLQSLQQPTQVPGNRYQIPAQMQQVPHQPTSAPSPLSQSPQELFQSQFLASNLYSASGFPGSQSFVSIPIVATTTTPSYATSSTRTQALPGQQPKTVTSSMFGPPGSQTQTVYMPFDPQNIGGTATLLNFNQQSQAQRPLIGNHGVGFTDVLTQQPHMAQSNHHQAPQFQRPFAFQTKPSYESEHNASLKPGDQGQNEFSHPQSEMVKHINAKPFEPPKRLSTPTSLSTSSGGTVGLMTSGVNPNVVHIRPNPPNIGALSHSPPVQTSYISNRPVSMSPVDPNVPFPAGANSYVKHAPIGHYQLPQQQRQQPTVQQFTPFQQQPVHIKPQQLQHQQHPLHMQQGQPSHSQQQQNATHIAQSGAPGIPPQALLQRQYGPVGTVGPSQHAVSNQRFPGPIQRPSSGVMQSMPQNILQHQPRPIQQPRPVRQQVPRMPHNMQKPPLMANRPPMPQQIQTGTQQNPFKALQHQKMLQETRMFFATQEQQVKMKSQQQNSEADKPNQLPQQQVQKQQGQSFQQSNFKQTHSHSKQDSKVNSQRQSVQQKQVPLAPSSGAHHQNKPPRMSQDKSKQSSQDKKDRKEENKSHIIELPRKKTQDSSNKSKQTKVDSSKNEDTSQTSKSDGKPSVNKRGGPIRIAPMIQKPSQGSRGGNRPSKPRPPFKNTPPSVQPNKAKAEVTTAAITKVATAAPTTTTAAASATKPVHETAASTKSNESSSKEVQDVKAADSLTVIS